MYLQKKILKPTLRNPAINQNKKKHFHKFETTFDLSIKNNQHKQFLNKNERSTKTSAKVHRA